MGEREVTPTTSTAILPPSRRFRFLPLQLPRHTSRIYYLVRLTTTLITVLAIILYIGLICYEYRISDTLPSRDFGSGMFIMLIMAACFLVPSLIISILDLYLPRFNRGALIGLELLFLLPVFSMAVFVAIFWTWRYRPEFFGPCDVLVRYDQDTNTYDCTSPSAPLYNFGCVVLFCMYTVVVGTFWTWVCNIHALKKKNTRKRDMMKLRSDMELQAK